MFEVSITSEVELESTARSLLIAFPEARTFAFHGEMGAGKTTFIKAICRRLGVKDQMSSPTSSLVNEYINKEGKQVFHFDFYRLRSLDEAIEAGLEDYFYSDAYCFVEWPEKAPELLPAETIDVFIVVQGTNRLINAKPTS